MGNVISFKVKENKTESMIDALKSFPEDIVIKNYLILIEDDTNSIHAAFEGRETLLLGMTEQGKQFIIDNFKNN